MGSQVWVFALLLTAVQAFQLRGLIQHGLDKMKKNLHGFNEVVDRTMFPYALADIKEAVVNLTERGNCEKIPRGKSVDPQVFMTTCEMVKYYGYPCETHKVVTEDNYILGVHRIPYGR